MPPPLSHPPWSVRTHHKSSRKNVVSDMWTIYQTFLMWGHLPNIRYGSAGDQGTNLRKFCKSPFSVVETLPFGACAAHSARALARDNIEGSNMSAFSSLPGRGFFDKISARAESIDSLLCVGLDPHVEELGDDKSAAGATAFCLNLIEKTSRVAVAYKPNAAFFEAFGVRASSE